MVKKVMLKTIVLTFSFMILTAYVTASGNQETQAGGVSVASTSDTSIGVVQPRDALGDCNTYCQVTNTDCLSGGPCSADEYPCNSEYEYLNCQKWCYNLFFGWVMVDEWQDQSFAGCCEPCVMSVDPITGLDRKGVPSLYPGAFISCDLTGTTTIGNTSY